MSKGFESAMQQPTPAESGQGNDTHAAWMQDAGFTRTAERTTTGAPPVSAYDMFNAARVQFNSSSNPAEAMQQLNGTFAKAAALAGEEYREVYESTQRQLGTGANDNMASVIERFNAADKAVRPMAQAIGERLGDHADLAMHTLGKYINSDRHSSEGQFYRAKTREVLTNAGQGDMADAFLSAVDNAMDLKNSPPMSVYMDKVLPHQVLRLQMLDRYSDMALHAGDEATHATVNQQIAGIEQTLPSIVREAREAGRLGENIARSMGMRVEH